MMPLPVKINVALRKHLCQKIGSERVKYCKIYDTKLTISYISCLCQLPGMVKSKVPPSYQSATPTFHRDPSKSTQMYEEVASSQPTDDALGRPMVHTSGAKQASGEAIYIDDMPKFKG